MNAYKDRIAAERVKDRNRARVELGAGDVPRVAENRDDEQIAVRHADASGGDITENQHEENRMRDIHVGKRGSAAASEEQPDKLRKTIRFEQEAPSVSASRVVRHKIGRGPYLCRSLVMLMTTYKFLRWVRSSRRMDERVVISEKCWTGIGEKMLEISREVN